MTNHQVRWEIYSTSWWGRWFALQSTIGTAKTMSHPRIKQTEKDERWVCLGWGYQNIVSLQNGESDVLNHGSSLSPSCSCCPSHCSEWRTKPEDRTKVYPHWRLRHSSNMSHWASSSQMLLKMEATSASRGFVGNGIAKHDFPEVIARRLKWEDPKSSKSSHLEWENQWLKASILRNPLESGSKRSASLQPKARKQHLQWSTDRGRRSERYSSAERRGVAKWLVDWVHMGTWWSWHGIEPNNLCKTAVFPPGAVGADVLPRCQR